MSPLLDALKKIEDRGEWCQPVTATSGGAAAVAELPPEVDLTPEVGEPDELLAHVLEEAEELVSEGPPLAPTDRLSEEFLPPPAELIDVTPIHVADLPEETEESPPADELANADEDAIDMVRETDLEAATHEEKATSTLIAAEPEEEAATKTEETLDDEKGATDEEEATEEIAEPVADELSPENEETAEELSPGDGVEAEEEASSSSEHEEAIVQDDALEITELADETDSDPPSEAETDDVDVAVEEAELADEVASPEPAPEADSCDEQELPIEAVAELSGTTTIDPTESLANSVTHVADLLISEGLLEEPVAPVVEEVLDAESDQSVESQESAVAPDQAEEDVREIAPPVAATEAPIDEQLPSEPAEEFVTAELPPPVPSPAETEIDDSDRDHARSMLSLTKAFDSPVMLLVTPAGQTVPTAEHRQLAAAMAAECGGASLVVAFGDSHSDELAPTPSAGVWLSQLRSRQTVDAANPHGLAGKLSAARSRFSSVLVVCSIKERLLGEISSACDATFLHVPLGECRQRDIAKSQKKLRKAGVTLTACIATQPPHVQP